MTAAASLPSDAAETLSAPPETSKTPLSTAKPCIRPSFMLAVRRTSRLPPGMFPACGSAGAPVCFCHSPLSFCVTRPISPFGSPLRATFAASLFLSSARVGSAPCAFESTYRNSNRPGGTCRLTVAIPERGERDDVAVELADPVDQSVAAGVPDQDVAAGTAVGEVLIRRVRVGLVVEPAVRLQVVVGVQQVVAPATPERVLR